MRQAPRSRQSWLALAVALLLHAISPRADAQGPLDVVAAPEPHPVQVGMGLTIIDFARINNREETFDVHGYLEVRWVDKRLKRNPGSGADQKPGKKRRLHPSHELWIPRLSFMNAVEEVKIVSHSEIFTDDDGNVSQGLDFTGKFSNPLDLRRFPFDSQTLRILIQPTDADKSEIILMAGEFRSGVLAEAFLSDWDVGTSTAQTQDYLYHADGTIYSTFVSATRVQRRSTFYVFRVLLPLTLLVMASWVIFWFDVTQLQPQISTALSIMIATVLFSFGTDFGMVRVAYLTLVDRQVLLSFLFAFFAIVSVAFLHVVQRKKGQALAERYQHKLRGLFPLAYVVTLAVTHGTH